MQMNTHPSHPAKPSPKTRQKVVTKIINAESLNIRDTAIGSTKEALKNITKMLKRLIIAFGFINLI